jgi:anaerobic selenocysteine-containing dehydrogenase
VLKIDSENEALNDTLRCLQVFEAAKIYWESENSIACWCLGITHHLNSVETIREIVNLMMLKGNIAKPGSGVCPVRGHSNIQGIFTVGVGENILTSTNEISDTCLHRHINRSG